MQKKLFLYRLRILLTISFVWILFGIIFYENLIHESNDLDIHVTLFQFAFTFGIIGLLISATLVYFLKPAFNHQPIWMSTIYKLTITLFIFFFIAFFLLLIYFLFLYEGNVNFNHYLKNFFTRVVKTHTFQIFMIDMAIMTVITISILEVNDKYGPGMFWSMLVGEYHRPVVENRIFIFLDINEATSIAEELGHEKYFRMLRRFFADITIPLITNDGSIYQYVGDEVVVSWRNTPENKIKALKFIRNTYFLIERFGKQYKKSFGIVPRFKAGVHAGEVTAGFVGIVKRELIYSGDTVNTTARIRSMCHELDASFILSEDFMDDFHEPHGYTIEKIGNIELKGRLEPVKLFSLNFD